MKAETGATCKACREGALEEREVAQAFEREGLEVKIEGVPALVCDACGQIYYVPGVSDKLAAAADRLFALSAVKHAGRFNAAV